MGDVEDHNKSLGVGHNYLSPRLVKSYITYITYIQHCHLIYPQRMRPFKHLVRQFLA